MQLADSPLQIRHTYSLPKPFRAWFCWLALGKCSKPCCTAMTGPRKFHRSTQSEGRAVKVGRLGMLQYLPWATGKGKAPVASACGALQAMEANGRARAGKG